MQVRILTVPLGDPGSALQELNAFLAGHRVLDMQQQFYLVNVPLSGVFRRSQITKDGK